VPNGPYIISLRYRTYPTGAGVVNSRDPRKLKTWLETGKRKGVKTKRKGAYAWRAGKKFAAAENKAGYFESEIASRLG
jgi:hypothetical protein